MTTPADTRFPNYLEMRSRVPARVWYAARAVSVTGVVVLVVVLIAWPSIGLKAWWLFILPCVPLVWMLAPGLWRNVCPMAAVNQVPRVLGFTRGRSLPPWLRKHGYAIQVVFYFSLISTRAPVLDHSGVALAVLMLVALAAAFAGGVIYKGKSGWCGSLCPLMPVQKLYGQTPAVVVPNAHCETCVGCTRNCYDFNPRVALIADVNDPDPDWVNYRKVFAGTFPGFVVAFFTIPDSRVGEAADMGTGIGSYYLLTAAYMLVSLGVFFLLDAFVKHISTVVLMALFAMLALNAHNILRFPTSFAVDKPTWLLVVEGLAVFAVTMTYVVRTWRQERAVLAEAAGPARGELVVQLPSAVAELAPANEHEIEFTAGGPRTVAPDGATLLAVAERTGMPIEAGCRMGVCGADPVAVLAGADNLSEQTADEHATLERLGLARGCVRLACCARVHGHVTVSLDEDEIARAARPAQPVARERRFDADVRSVVVIGNGIAGVTAADHVRRNHPECRIDLIGEEPHQFYNRMGIARMIFGRSAMQGLQLLPDEWYAENRVTSWLNTQALTIDRDDGVVALATGERLSYDRIVLAMGSRPTAPPIAGIDRRGTFFLRTADDAIAMRGFIQRERCRRAVVIGGGLLGLEAAYALHKLHLHVTVVHRRSRLADRQFDAVAAGMIASYFAGLGIDTITDAEPLAVDGDGRARSLRLGDGRVLGLDLLAVCCGVQPDVALAREAGLSVRHGVIVDDHMRSSDPRIFAAGDIAEINGHSTGLWPAAVAQATVAAAAVAGVDGPPYADAAVPALLKGTGLHALSVGRIVPEPGDSIVAGQGEDGPLSYRKLVVRDDVVVGAILIGHADEATAVIETVREGRPLAHAVAGPVRSPAASRGDV